MTKKEYIASCIYDALSALDVANLPQSIQVGDDWIYPRVAIQRIKSIRDADELFKDKED